MTDIENLDHPTDDETDPDSEPDEVVDPPQDETAEPIPTPEDPPGHCLEVIPPIARIPEGGPDGEY